MMRSCVSLVVAAGEQVAGDLLAHELVVGQVAIERVDDPVAIAVHLRNREIGVVARGVGVAHDIEPVTAPALAVARRGEQPVDDRGEGVRRVVGEERRRPPPASAAGRSDRTWRGGSARACRHRPRAAGRPASRRARMKRSMSFAGHAAFFTAGGWRRGERTERPPLARLVPIDGRSSPARPRRCPRCADRARPCAPTLRGRR